MFLADTTCILALYMITQTMTHVLGQLVPLYSAGIVIYRRFCRVSRCFHKFIVTGENSNAATPRVSAERRRTDDYARLATGGVVHV